VENVRTLHWRITPATVSGGGRVHARFRGTFVLSGVRPSPAFFFLKNTKVKSAIVVDHRLSIVGTPDSDGPNLFFRRPVAGRLSETMVSPGHWVSHNKLEFCK
jgi:hypothetical protein